MRFPHFFLPLALVFCLQITSVYTDNPIVGTWTGPETYTNNCVWCCVPLALNIQNYGSSQVVATFLWSDNTRCTQLFGLPETGLGFLVLDKNDAGYYFGRKSPYYYSTVDTFYFEMLDDGRLNVYNAAPGAACNFVMDQIVSLPSSTLANTLLMIPGAILAIMILLRIYYNSLQKTFVVQQIYELSKRKTQPQAQLESQVDRTFSDAPIYVAPSMYISMYQNQQAAEQNTPQSDPEMAAGGVANQGAQQADAQAVVNEEDSVDMKKDVAGNQVVDRPDPMISLKMNVSGNKSNNAGGGKVVVTGFVDNRFEF